MLTLWIIHVFAAVGKNVVEHTLCLYSRRLRVEGDGLKIVVKSMLPVALTPVFVAEIIVFFSCHIFICSFPFYLQPMCSSSASRWSSDPLRPAQGL